MPQAELSSATAQSSDSASLLDEVKRLALRDDPALYDAEKRFLKAADRVVPEQWPAPGPTPASEFEALHTLKDAHGALEHAAAGERAASAALKTAAARDGSPNELSDLIQNHFQTLHAQDDKRLELIYAESHYQPFREDPEPNTTPEHQALRDLVNAYAGRETAQFELEALTTLKEEPEKIPEAQARFEEAQQNLKERLDAFQSRAPVQSAERSEQAPNRTTEPTQDASVGPADVTAQFDSQGAEIAAVNPRLEAPIERPVDEASDPGASERPGFRTELADALQKPSILHSKAFAAHRNPAFVETRSDAEIRRDDLIDAADRFEAAGRSEVAANLRNRAQDVQREIDAERSIDPHNAHILDFANTDSTNDPAISDDQKPARGEDADAQTTPVPATVAEVAQHLDSLRAEIAAANPRLDAAIERLADETADPGASERPGFRTELADALQDAERITGPLEIEPALRDDLSERATSEPGLSNARLQALLKSTPTLDDQSVVDDIRTLAQNVALRQNQESPAINRQIDHIENRLERSQAPAHNGAALRLVEESLGLSSERQPSNGAVSDGHNSPDNSIDQSRSAPPDASQSQSPSAPSGAPTSGGVPYSATDSTAPTSPRPSGAPAEDARARARREISAFDPPAVKAATQANADRPDRPSGRETPTAATAATPSAPAQSAAQSPTGGAASASQGEQGAEPARQATEKPIEIEVKTTAEQSRRGYRIPVPAPFGGLAQKVLNQLDEITRAEREQTEALKAQAEAHGQAQGQARKPASNLSDRLDRYEVERLAPQRLEKDFQNAHADGEEAVKALKDFSKGPGQAVLQRIEAAAQNDPHGLQGVLSELRPGGAYEDLRKQFNAAYANNSSFAAAYDRASAALAQYGESRQAIIPNLPKHPNAAKWQGEFETLDAQIGDAASKVPGRQVGTSALDHLAEKTREIVEKLIEKVKSAFRADPNPESRPSPSPGP